MSDPFDDGRERILTDEQCAYLGEWLRRGADMLGLKDWRVSASPFVSEKSADASSFIRDETDESVIAVGKNFLKDAPDDQRATLTHELLHPHFYRVTRMAERLMDSELGRRTEGVIESAIELTEELAIERLAHAIAGWLPPFQLPKSS